MQIIFKKSREDYFSALTVWLLYPILSPIASNSAVVKSFPAK